MNVKEIIDKMTELYNNDKVNNYMFMDHARATRKEDGDFGISYAIKYIELFESGAISIVLGEKFTHTDPDLVDHG